jgi:hypothetical protein
MRQYMNVCARYTKQNVCPSTLVYAADRKTNVCAGGVLCRFINLHHITTHNTSPQQVEAQHHYYAPHYSENS